MVYVGRIGDVDAFIGKLVSGRLDLNRFRDPSFRERYEKENNFGAKGSLDEVLEKAAKAKHDAYCPMSRRGVDIVSRVLWREPRFRYLGRYNHRHKDMFACVKRYCECE